MSALFRPRIRFTIGGGWTSNLEEAFAFELARETAGATLVFDSFVAQRSVGDVVSLVRSVSGLDATQPIAVTLGGVSGQRFEFTMTATTQVLVEPLQYAFEPGDVGRIYVLDVRGQTVVVIVAAKAADFTAFASAAEQVLATVRFPS